MGTISEDDAREAIKDLVSRILEETRPELTPEERATETERITDELVRKLRFEALTARIRHMRVPRLRFR